MNKVKVTFFPDNKTVEVERGTTILSAAISAGISVNSSCGGDGVCGRCKVILKSGNVYSQPTGRITLEERQKNIYLACLASIESDLEVEIPTTSRLDLRAESAQDTELRMKDLFSKAEEIEIPKPVLTEKLFAYLPLTTKIYLELPKPSLQDSVSDLDRIYRQIIMHQDIPIMQTGLANIRQLGELLRDSDWKVTVTLGRRNGTTEIVLIEPGNTSGRNYGVCFDIGTTTISGQLVDLNHKKVLGTMAAYNKQATFGSDVITRIIFAQKQDGLEKLHHAVIDGINQIIQDLIKEHSIDLNNLTAFVCSGNTTMTHLLLRIDPSNIRRDPYIPTANFVPVIRAAEAGIKINPRGLLWCVPGVASYVGGDITAGVLACNIDNEEDLSVLIDIGTNGEVVLGSREFLVSCAASAGPAFEGSGVSCGMRSSRGAIQKVKINNNKVSFETIGNDKARGICGSGYIDIIAELLHEKIMDKDGKLEPKKSDRVRDGEIDKEFVVAYKEEADAVADIVITEADIENIKRAKAAIYAAFATLTRHMDIKLSQIRKFFIAGGFGTSINIESAIKIGLLPNFPLERFIFMGNSSLIGARQALLSEQAANKAQDIAQKMSYLELSTESGYMDEYMAALFFPHTDFNQFNLRG